MKKVTKLLMILALAGPSVMTMSCSNVFTRQMRDAIFAAAADFTQTQASNTLNGFGG